MNVSLYLYTYESHGFDHMHGIKVCRSALDDVGVEIRRRKDLQVCFLFWALQEEEERQVNKTAYGRWNLTERVGQRSTDVKSLSAWTGEGF